MVNGQQTTVNGQPTPNRAQSSLLELPRCEGGKDHEVGLTVNGQQTTVNGQWSMVMVMVMVNGEGIKGVAFRRATLQPQNLTTL